MPGHPRAGLLLSLYWNLKEIIFENVFYDRFVHLSREVSELCELFIIYTGFYGLEELILCRCLKNA